MAAKEKPAPQPADDTPIGLLPDGSIACFAPGKVPAYEPEIVSGDDEPEDEVEDAEDL